MIENATQIKKTVCCIVALCALFSFDANAANNEPVTMAALSLSMAALLLAILFFGMKLVSRNLKKVDKHLKESFGEKILP